MSYYGFFESVLNTTKQKFDEMVKMPRARGGNLAQEVKEILNNIAIAKRDKDITEDEANYLTSEFQKIDFTTLSKVRAANKERENYNVGFKFNR